MPKPFKIRKSKRYKLLFKYCSFIIYSCFIQVGLAQTADQAPITFDFDAHDYTEKYQRLEMKQVGTTLTYDRFGNADAAVYLHGHFFSYLNLGTSHLLKPEVGSISIWFNLDRYIYAGKGTDINPILITKNKVEDDFYEAYCVYYQAISKHIGVAVASDSTGQICILSQEELQFSRWYHAVITFDQQAFRFYLNGVLQQISPMKLKMTYLANDSVVVGITANQKNKRCSQGRFDDIKIFNRVLSQNEIVDLYQAPNPNAFKNNLKNSFKYLAIIVILLVVLYLLFYFNKRTLNRQKAELELKYRISDLELAVVKAQIKPHFISNCLAAIQELVFLGEPEKAKQYIDKFNAFINQILFYSDKNFITLQEELSILQLNVQFEQLRFKQTFNFVLTIDSSVDCERVLIPSLITQPFIENAIWHGLLRIKDGRLPVLTVNILMQNTVPIIEIVDNGVGRGATANLKNSSKGISLVLKKISNLNTYIKSEIYRFIIEDLTDDKNSPSGTKVIIYLNPIQHEPFN